MNVNSGVTENSADKYSRQVNSDSGSPLKNAFQDSHGYPGYVVGGNGSDGEETLDHAETESISERGSVSSKLAAFASIPDEEKQFFFGLKNAEENRKRLSDYQITLVIISMLFVGVEVEIKERLESDYEYVADLLKGVVTIASILTVLVSGLYHQQCIKLRKVQGDLSLRETLFTNVTPAFLLEIFINAFHIPPFVNKTFKWMSVGRYGEPPVPYTLDLDTANLLVVLRLYVILRLMRYHGPLFGHAALFVSKLNQIDLTMSFTVKTVLNKKPFLLLVPLLMGSALLFSFGIHIFERNANPIMSSFPNALWLLVVTFTTVGYGDYIPHTQIGRVLITMAASQGILITAMTVAIVSKKLALSQAESRVLHLLRRSRWRIQCNEQAVIVIQTAWRLYVARNTGPFSVLPAPVRHRKSILWLQARSHRALPGRSHLGASGALGVQDTAGDTEIVPMDDFANRRDPSRELVVDEATRNKGETGPRRIGVRNSRVTGRSHAHGGGATTTTSSRHHRLASHSDRMESFTVSTMGAHPVSRREVDRALEDSVRDPTTAPPRRSQASTGDVAKNLPELADAEPSPGHIEVESESAFTDLQSKRISKMIYNRSVNFIRSKTTKQVQRELNFFARRMARKLHREVKKFRELRHSMPTRYESDLMVGTMLEDLGNEVQHLKDISERECEQTHQNLEKFKREIRQLMEDSLNTNMPIVSNTDYMPGAETVTARIGALEKKMDLILAALKKSS